MSRAGTTETEFYGVPDVASFLGLSMKTIVRAIGGGNLKATRFGNQWRIHRDDLKAYAGRLPGEASTPEPSKPKPFIDEEPF